MTKQQQKQLDAAWTYVLKLWRQKQLPTPLRITAEGKAIILPPNARDGVDAWASALGITRTSHDNDSYSYHSGENDQWWVMCRIDCNVAPAPAPAVLAAADGVAEMLAGVA